MNTVEDVMAELAEKTAIADEQDAIAAEKRADQHAAIVKAYLEHKSLRDIADLTGLSHEGVRGILAKAGVELRGRGRPSRSEP